ncbi:ABC transporter substrate-binding protein [Aerococcus sanguinicola]|uniref:ABC transporter substrate-binding protein n=1 Tax=unclassified Aerococcus TaxID=2618060 RepID=UPI001306D130|nr:MULTISPECIES: ABC transporter substrate-binding protein [unclassified Aerococcus]KAB0647350.1 ABC transporter substrate-binding protein [Aerococcus sanguinicola]MDK6233186.1 ABC transporter substrate-binding protein [Aerococcus sp. UMB10185]MDK6856023.1 ABC transporter substrate-binding protein [Aerococcus sp. UMB7533]MDK8502382.1 ABC transporter substrate-binding protein [Aerococcus sp. UMB1112A]
MKKKSIFGVISLLLLALVVGGCNEAATNSGDNQASKTEKVSQANENKELEKVTITEPAHAVLWAPVYLAKNLGYFEEQGLDAEITTVQGDTPTAPVLSGQAEFGLFGPEMITGFNEQGQGTKLIVTTTKKFPYALVSGKDFPTVESLKGTTINAQDSGSSPRQFARASLKKAGLNPDSDVTYANVANPAVLAALDSGELSASVASPEIRKQVLDAGNNLLVDMYDPKVHKDILGSEDYEMYITFVKDELIEKNPELVQKYVNAVYKAILWMNENSVDEVVKNLEADFPEMKNLKEVVTEMKEQELLSKDGGFTDEGFEAIKRMSKEAGVLKNDIEKEKVIDESFIKEAQENVELN